MIQSLLRAQGSLVLLERALWEDFEYLIGITHYHDEDGLLYVTIEVFKGSTPDGPCILGERSPILSNCLVSTKHSTVPVHVHDVVLMSSREKDSVSAIVEWGSDVEKVLKSDGDSNGLSSVFELDSSTSPTASPPGDVGQRKRSAVNGSSRM